MADYRSRTARLGAALGGRLFSAEVREAARAGDDPQAAIRTAIRRRRRTLGLTQAQAARLVGMAPLAYHRIEAGSRRIDFAELAALCAAYRCHIGELIQDGPLAQAFADAAMAVLGRAPALGG